MMLEYETQEACTKLSQNQSVYAEKLAEVYDVILKLSQFIL